MKTHLYGYHKNNARLTNFAGFEMPLWYEGIIPEHMAVRESVGIFDVTHMGRYLIYGNDSVRLLNIILTQDVNLIEIGQGVYSLICNENGGIIDDVVIFRLRKDRFLITCNAANRKKDYEWISAHADGFSVNIEDLSDETAMFAVQGPKALDTLQPIIHADLSGLKYFWGNTAKIENFDVFISRSGYTGEDGFEIILWNTPLDDPERAYSLWNMILQSGEKYGIKPCGLGARDTLRIEAGYVLYGNDIDEAITPLEAKLDFAVCFGKDYFIGREMLLKQKIEGVKRIRVGIRLLERGVLRPKCEIRLKDRVIGEVTSGTFSPLLKCGIGMGYVPVENAKPGTLVDVVIRGKMIEAVISKMPFYDTVKYGRKRKEK